MILHQWMFIHETNPDVDDPMGYQLCIVHYPRMALIFESNWRLKVHTLKKTHPMIPWLCVWLDWNNCPITGALPEVPHSMVWTTSSAFFSGLLRPDPTELPFSVGRVIVGWSDRSGLVPKFIPWVWTSFCPRKMYFFCVPKSWYYQLSIIFSNNIIWCMIVQ